jgi:methionyl-tRNA synthetase
MSKSRGTFFTAREFLQKYNPEYLRFYYAGFLSKTLSDVNLDFNDFRSRINNELAANVGNFSYRTLSFLNKHFDGKVNELDENPALKEEISKTTEAVKKNYSALNFNEALKGILYISSLGNKYFQSNEPWKLVNTDKEKTHKILGLCVNIVKDLSILLQPVLPNISAELQSQLSLESLKWKDLGFNVKSHKAGKEKILIMKMEEEKEEKKIFPLNLKIAKILEVKEHPNADKLYVLQIDLGSEKRQLVAGLRSHYTPEELLGKKIVVIANLKYAKLRGVESQGMLLAGGDEKTTGVLTVEKSEAGDKVFIEGYENSSEQLTYDEFAKLSLIVKNGHASFDNKEIKTGKEVIKVERAIEGSRIK